MGRSRGRETRLDLDDSNKKLREPISNDLKAITNIQYDRISNTIELR